jgi:hypothetical protein
MGLDGMYIRDATVSRKMNIMDKYPILQDDLRHDEIVDDSSDIVIDINKIKKATISFIMSLRTLLENKFWETRVELKQFILSKLPPPPPGDTVRSFSLSLSLSLYSIPVQLKSLTERYIKDVEAEVDKWDELDKPEVLDKEKEVFKPLLDSDKTIDKCNSNISIAKEILTRVKQLKGGKKKSRKSKRGKANKSKKYRKK